MRNLYTTDIEAIVCRPFLSPDPPQNPFTLILSIHSATARETFDRDRACDRCERYDKTYKEEDSGRPAGTHNREFCNGCAYSYLDPVTVDMEAVRDRLYEEWVKLKATFEELKSVRKHAQSHEERADWKADFHRTQRQLTEASRACFAAGFNPLKRARREESGDPKK